MASRRGAVKRIVAELVRQGFRVRFNKHYVIFPPDPTKPRIVMAGTSSDGYGIKNALKDLEEAGFIPPNI